MEHSWRQRRQLFLRVHHKAIFSAPTLFQEKLGWWRWVGSDPEDASGVGGGNEKPRYEPKDTRVARFVRKFFPWGGRIHCWKPWNICRSWPLPWSQTFDLWLKHPGRIKTWAHSPRILEIRKFWRQFVLVGIGGVYRYNKEGPRSETGNLEARLAGPKFDQWSWLWENLHPHYSLRGVSKWNPVLSEPSFHFLFLLNLLLSWFSAFSAPVLAYEWKGHLFLVSTHWFISTSKNLSHHPALTLKKDLNQHFILVDDENQGERERGFCAAYNFISYKIVIQFDCWKFC